MTMKSTGTVPKKVIFAHGFEGRPNGRKATYLRDSLGMEVVAPTLHSQGWCFSDHVSVLSETLDLHPEISLLVGSSMGGLASAVALSNRPSDAYKTILLAPAFGVHESFRNRLGEKAFSQWSSSGFIQYQHAAVGGLVDLPFSFWTECRAASRTVIEANTVIIHGAHDAVIPLSESVSVARRSPGVLSLFQADDDHRLAGSLALIRDALAVLYP
ncbi:MAG: YqiA/YcfP family alpha/beta fold hydrolase [Myxococcota bacterium]|nr:YqiA/YcfP family alpha/beta fold hydrolase [Myxococcota bacterium]